VSVKLLPANPKKITEKRILRAVEYYVPLIGLEDWTLKVLFDPTIDAAASCEADEEYRSAKLCFNIPKMKENNEPVARTVRHELLHCLTWPQTQVMGFLAKTKPAQEMARLAEERSTTWLECMPVWDMIE